MNIFGVIASATKVLSRGKAIQMSDVLTNAEAGAASLYAFFSALVELLKACGVDVQLGGTDIHQMANGTTALASLGYSVYRAATNPETGFKAEK
jgi:hypothetical protein